MRLKIKIISNAKENKVVGEMADGVLKIKINAPAVDNKANEALIKFLSKEFGRSKTKIKIVSGLTSRNKIIEVAD